VAGRMLAEGDIASLSRQLFAKEPVLIETRVTPGSESLLAKLADIEGVTRVEQSGDTLLLSCQFDCSPEIARVVVESGESLRHLAQKEYGLDEIYHRYFEGGM
jgi:ABC-2 type transport system ATP-binding protein